MDNTTYHHIRGIIIEHYETLHRNSNNETECSMIDAEEQQVLQEFEQAFDNKK